VNLIGATAYAVTAGLYALLCVLLLVSWRGKRPGAYLIAAAVVSSIWGGTLAVQTAATQFSPLIWYFVEVGRLSVWILFLTSLLRDMGVSRRLGIVANPSLEQPVEFLSGGNQQKVVVSRTFLRKPSVILAYEPTQGVDVGSRFDIYKALRARTNEGAALLVKSSDPLELAGLCDRVLVLSRGQVIEEIPGDELDEVRIVEAIVRGPGLSKAGRSPFGVAMPKAPTSLETP
jgi:hypothetical protein